MPSTPASAFKPTLLKEVIERSDKGLKITEQLGLIDEHYGQEVQPDRKSTKGLDRLAVPERNEGR